MANLANLSQFVDQLFANLEKDPSAPTCLVLCPDQKIGVLGNGWHTQSLRWVWFFLRISHALRKASERATQKSNLDKAVAT
jgi:hypothetical protein